MATRDLTKIEAGPCKLTFGAVDVGHTQEGVEFNYEPEIRERVVDEYGTTAVELILVGENVTITCRITQWELANLKLAIPSGQQGSGYLGFGRKPGYELGAQEGAELIVHPLELGDAVTTQDVTLWKAVPNSPVAIGWNNEGDRIFEVVFKALPDTTKADGEFLGELGAAS